MFTEPVPHAPRVALVAGSASKLQHPAPARELYTSALFRASLAYAEVTCSALLIVSAFHGVVAPNAVVGLCDRLFRELSKPERERWGVRTIGQLLPSFPVPPRLVILAGPLYAAALIHGASTHNLPRPDDPLRGVRGLRSRIDWLRTRTASRAPHGGSR